MPSFAEGLSNSDRSSLSVLGFVFSNLGPPNSVLKDIRVQSSAKPVEQLPELPSHEPLIVELCAGHAVLSATAEAAGFQSLAVDSNAHRAPGHRILRLDLADPDNVDHSWR